MTWLLDTFEVYEAEMLAIKRGEDPDDLGISHGALGPATRRILANLITLAERFARGKSVEPVQQSILTIYTDILSSHELRSMSREVDAFIRRVLVEPGYVQTAECVARGIELRTRTQALLSNELYGAHWSALTSGVLGWLGWTMDTPRGAQVVTPFYDDPLTRRLDKDWQRLVKSILQDSRGHLMFKRQLWSDIGGMIGPALGGLGYIPVPRLELANPTVELVLENVYLSVSNLVPSIITVEEDIAYKWSPFDSMDASCAAANHWKLRIHVQQVQADVKNVPFSLLWKKGIRYADTGLVDITLARNGLSIVLDVEIDRREDYPSVLVVHNVDVSVDELEFTFRNTRRDWLFRLLFATVAVPALKHLICTKLEAKLKERLAQLDVHLVDVRDRLKAASKDIDARRKEGEATPGTSGTLLRVLSDKMKEIRQAKKLHAPVFAGEKGARDAVQKADNEAAAGRSPEKQPHVVEPEPASDVEEPGGPPRRKKFKISSRLEDTLLPTTTPNADESWVYRRWRAEEAARLSGRASAEMEATTNVVAATATGLRLGSPRPWRSPVFTFQ